MMSHDDALTQERNRQAAYRLWEEAGCPEGQEMAFWLQAEREIATVEAKYDRELIESFPASDPPANSGIMGMLRAEPLPVPEAPILEASIPKASVPETRLPVVAPAEPPPGRGGWRAEAARRFQAWWEYPSNRGSR